MDVFGIKITETPSETTPIASHELEYTIRRYDENKGIEDGEPIATLTLDVRDQKKNTELDERYESELDHRYDRFSADAQIHMEDVERDVYEEMCEEMRSRMSLQHPSDVGLADASEEVLEE